MHWVLQDLIRDEPGFEALITAIERQGASYSIHQCATTTGELVPEPVLEHPHVIAMGSYALARIARARGWCPGGFLNDRDDVVAERAHWGSRLLNDEAVVVRLDEVPEQPRPFFIRPAIDSKVFTGRVTDWVAWQAWRAEALAAGTLDGAMRVAVAPVREIYTETRTWIVDGRVATASGYKLGSVKRYSRPDEVDARITRFAAECAAVWAPARAFVLDVADTPDGLKIIETNNLSAAGLYQGDMNALVGALEAMDLQSG